MAHTSPPVSLLKESLDKDGYVLVPKVFSRSEVEQFRELAYAQYRLDENAGLTSGLKWLPNLKLINGDLLSKENLSAVLLDDRILKIARDILGSNDIVYFGDSSFQIGLGLRGFHRDNIDRTDMNGPEWDGKEYPLLRLGIYLQNHKDYSGGLKIKKGSHQNPDGKAIFVDNEPGDVVAWSLKTLHSGNAVRIKGLPGFSINKPGPEGRIPAFLRKDEPCERISLFMTFALSSPKLTRYLDEYFLKRNDTKEHIRASNYRPGILKIAEQKGLKVLKLNPDV